MDDLLFANETNTEKDNMDSFAKPPWKILVVDDEDDIHSVTKLTLKRFYVKDRPLLLISAYSKADAIEKLNEHDDIALAIIDVVMETGSAGLELVEYIRNILKNKSVRLVLRTGQPGQAPESEVISNYDINDYKNKTELTSQKLKTLCYSAIRSYTDIITIEKSRVGIRKVLETSSNVLKSSSLGNFATAVLNQVVTLLNTDDIAVYAFTIPTASSGDRKSLLIAATSDSSQQVNNISFEELPVKIRNRMTQSLKEEKSLIFDDGYITYLKTGSGHTNLLSVNSEKQLNKVETELLELYCSNVSLTHEMLLKNEEIQDVQRQLVLLLGDAVESRSKETGAHVRRVSLVCELLARDLGLDETKVELIKLASPLHDIGKVAIPDNILHKSGRLNDEEWEIMKTHADIGGKILSKSNQAIFKIAAEIAAKHHEHWDGQGYPKGLSGQEIPLEARIVALVDVFDALGSVRSYKQPWLHTKIQDYLIEQKNKMFDPELVDTLINNFNRYSAIRDIYPDEDY